MNVSVVHEPLAFILPKKELVFCLDEKELVPELAAPAPEPSSEGAHLEPVSPAFPDPQQEVESAGTLQSDEPSAGT